MKSIKPGRGPSGMGFIGSVAAVILGLFWTIMAARLTAGAPFGIGAIFPLFGILFIILGIVEAGYHYKNATGKDRYSIYDITDSSEEGDPADRWIKRAGDESETDEFHESEQGYESKLHGINYCPFCGVKLDYNYNFCPNCGRRIK